jgi:uncharacterized protein
MPATFADVAKAQYILLTTFTKDDRPKPTLVCAATDGDRLLVITQGKSRKVKRIRNKPQVTPAVSDAIEATATILDKSQTTAPPVEDLDGQPRRLEISHALRV